mmetsp:Transcript_64364/g.112309  ORF Transcript_64364/g.112309 Transcript_64364/m.112309 type:complete len:493 (-) Transcript_64364:105-1583(-)
MRRTDLIPILLACVGHAIRVQRQARDLHKGIFNELNASLSLQALLALTSQSASAYNPCGTGVSTHMDNRFFTGRPALHSHQQSRFHPVVAAFQAAASPWKKQKYELSRQILGPEHPDTLRALNNYANAVGELGQLPELEPVQKEVLELRNRVLGPKHPDTIRALNEYTTTLDDLGRDMTAEPCSKDVLRRNQVSKVLTDYIKAQRKRFDHDVEADIEMMKQIWDRRHRILGVDHPDTIKSFLSYASTLGDLGHQDEAEPLKRQAFELSNLVLGPGHPQTLLALSSYADTLSQLGREADAEPLKKRVHGISRLAHGPEHPETVNALSSHADSLYELGRHACAEPLRKEVLEMRRRARGPKHAETLEALSKYAKTLVKLSRDTEAEPLFKELYELRRQIHGPEHPDTFISLSSYVDTLEVLGRELEAEKLLKEVAGLQRQELDPEHPEALGDLSDIDRAPLDLFDGDFEADPLRRELIQILSSVGDQQSPAVAV